MANQAYERHRHTFPLFPPFRIEGDELVAEHDHQGQSLSGNHVLIVGAEGNEYVEAGAIRALQAQGWLIVVTRPKSS